MVQYIPIYAAVAAAVLGLLGIFYTQYLTRKTITRALLAEIQRLKMVVAQHKETWDALIKSGKTEQYPLIPFTTDIYDKQGSNVGQFNAVYAVSIVKFYGDIKFLNNLQSIRSSQSTGVNSRKRFEKAYATALGRLVEEPDHNFATAFSKYGLGTPTLSSREAFFNAVKNFPKDTLHYSGEPAVVIPSFLKPVTPYESSKEILRARGEMELDVQPPPATSKIVAIADFSVEHQIQTEWCWAAVSSSVSRFYTASSDWSQCKLAAAELNADCCNEDTQNKICNKPWSLDGGLKRVGNFDKIDATEVTNEVVQDAIRARTPICCRIKWAGDFTGAHFIALSAIGTYVDGSIFVKIEDPFFGQLTKLFGDLSSAYQHPGDKWTHTYFTKTANNSLN